MTNEFCQSLKEVYEIIKLSDEEVRSKIPYKFKRYIYKNMDPSYNVKIDTNKSLIEQEDLTQTTKSILALIYRDYLVDAGKREELMQEELAILANAEKRKGESFDTKSLFQKINSEKISTQETQAPNENLMLVEKKDSLFRRIFLKIKNILRGA